MTAYRRDAPGDHPAQNQADYRSTRLRPRPTSTSYGLTDPLGSVIGTTNSSGALAAILQRQSGQPAVDLPHEATTAVSQ